MEDRWWTFDARHNERRVGRVLMATGRDAADVALTTVFGPNSLTKFVVLTEEIKKVPNASIEEGHFRNNGCSIPALEACLFHEGFLIG